MVLYTTSGTQSALSCSNPSLGGKMAMMTAKIRVHPVLSASYRYGPLEVRLFGGMTEVRKMIEPWQPAEGTAVRLGTLNDTLYASKQERIYDYPTRAGVL